jgi:hypothetical protein
VPQGTLAHLLGSALPSTPERRAGKAAFPGRPMPALTPAVLAHAPHRSVTRPSCHPTVNYADRDDRMARVWRLLPPIEAIDVRTACPDARYAGLTVAGPAGSGHTVVARRVVQGRLGRRRGQARPRPASSAHV